MSLIKRTKVTDAMPATVRQIFMRDVIVATIAIAISLIAAWHVLGFSYVSGDTPIVYKGDALHYQALYQATRENGWNGDVERAGAPFGTSHLDFPNADGLNLLLMRAIGLFTDSPFLVFNTYILLSFALCAMIGYAVYRRLGLGSLWALAAAIAFTLLPFHFQRAEHVFLLAYFVAAIAGWLALEVVHESAPGYRSSPARWLIVAAALACSMSGVYYAFFSCLIIAVAGLHASALTTSWRPFARASMIVAIVVSGTMTNLAPNFWHQIHHGKNPEVAMRQAGDSETYGLKMTQLMLPREHHRIDALASLRDSYEAGSPYSNESKTAALGAIGTLGFLLLLAIPFVSPMRHSIPAILVRASAPTYAAVLFATVGGLGSLFAFLLTPQLRGLNRISPFIAFFSILAAVSLLGLLVSKWKSGHRPLALIIAPVALVGVVLFDQLSPAGDVVAPIVLEQATKRAVDREFFSAVEKSLGPSAMVAQFPLLPYPEGFSTTGLGSYESLSGFLSTRNTHWTFGAMRGRPEDTWQRIVETFSPVEQVAAIDALGFSGIVVDRRGYADNGAGVEAGLTAAGLQAVVESADTFRVFLALPAAKNPRYRALAVAPEHGWSVVEHAAPQTWLWSSGDASLVMDNTTGLPRACYLELTLESYVVERTVSMWEGGRKLAEQHLEAGVPARLAAYLDAAPGRRTIDLRTDAPANTPPNDPRQLAFRLVMTKIPLCR